MTTHRKRFQVKWNNPPRSNRSSSRRATAHRLGSLALLFVLGFLAVCIGQAANQILAPEAPWTFTALLGAPMAFGLVRTKILPTANSVASGSTATVDLPIGLRYHSVTLVFGYDGANAAKETAGTLANQIVNDIKVLLNGKVQRLHSAKQLNAVNSANGAQYVIRTSGTMGSSGYREYLTIFFSEPWRKDTGQQAAMAWNIHPADVRSFQIQVDFATITTPILTGFYEYDALADRRIGAIAKMIRQTLPAVGTIVESASIQRPVADVLQVLHIFASSDGKFAQSVQLTVNGGQVQEPIDYLSQRARMFKWDLNPDTNTQSAANYLSPRFDLPLDVEDPIQTAVVLATVNELTLKVTLDGAASGTQNVMVIRAGPPD